MARSLSVAVISDVHLGTYGCHATELLNYLRSINPQILILNGDIIDGWQFSKRYFPQSHFEVINEIFKKVSEGTRVVYITGNHDEILRRYSDMEIGNILLTDKFLLNIDGKKMWIFHGDVFDNTTKGSAKIIAKLGGKGYDMLILLNRAINFCLKLMHKNKVSLSKKVKNGVKKAVTYINNFEQTIADLAIEKKYDFVICGHIHQPIIKNISQDDGSVTYLNSGDWIENLTALEYNNNEWSLYQYTECEFADIPKSKKMYKKYEVNLEMDILQYIHSTKTAI
ncbi:UDP-2,3-diacylglucosamine hydrolase [compost metagenome]